MSSFCDRFAKLDEVFELFLRQPNYFCPYKPIKSAVMQKLWLVQIFMCYNSFIPINGLFFHNRGSPEGISSIAFDSEKSTIQDYVSIKFVVTSS